MANAEQTASDLYAAESSSATVAGRRHKQDRTPGDGHIWVMVLGDLIIFGAYFFIFMIYRAMKPQEFLASQQYLNITIGVLNTLVLLASSWFIARSLQAARAEDHARALRLTYLGGLCGAVFILIKAYEWSTE